MIRTDVNFRTKFTRLCLDFFLIMNDFRKNAFDHALFALFYNQGHQ